MYAGMRTRVGTNRSKLFKNLYRNQNWNSQSDISSSRLLLQPASCEFLLPVGIYESYSCLPLPLDVRTTRQVALDRGRIVTSLFNPPVPVPPLNRA
jgi:hypothetical protein